MKSALVSTTIISQQIVSNADGKVSAVSKVDGKVSAKNMVTVQNHLVLKHTSCEYFQQDDFVMGELLLPVVGIMFILRVVWFLHVLLEQAGVFQFSLGSYCKFFPVPSLMFQRKMIYHEVVHNPHDVVFMSRTIIKQEKL